MNSDATALQLSEALAALDEANAGDPVSEEFGGISRPRSVIYAERMSECFEVLAGLDGPASYTRVHPFFDPYRDDPRFVRALERLK